MLKSGRGSLSLFFILLSLCCLGIFFSLESWAREDQIASNKDLSSQKAFESAQGLSWLMTAFVLDDYLYLRKKSWFSESRIGQVVDHFFQRPAVEEEEVLLQKFMQAWYEKIPQATQKLQSSTVFLDRWMAQDPEIQKHQEYYRYILYEGLGKTHNMALKMIFDLELTSDIKAKSLRLLDIAHQFLCIHGDMQRACFRIFQIFSVSKDPEIQLKVHQSMAVLRQKPNMQFWGNLFDPRNWLVAGAGWTMWKGLQLSSAVGKFLSNYSNLQKAAGASVGLHVLAYLGLQKVLPQDLPEMKSEPWQAPSTHIAAPDLVLSEMSLFFRNAWTYKSSYSQIQNRLFDWLISGELEPYLQFKKLSPEKTRQIYLQSLQEKQKILDSVLQLKKENKNMDKAGIVSVRSAIQNFLISYSKEEAFMLQGLAKGSVNCVARTLLLMAVFMPLENLLQAQGLQPAVMGFANHVEFVLFHQQSGRVLSLLSMSDMSAYLGRVSLYHPYVLLRQFLVNHHVPQSLSVGSFALGPAFQIEGASSSPNPFANGLFVTSLKYESEGPDGLADLDFSNSQILDFLPISTATAGAGRSMESAFHLHSDLTYIQSWKTSSIPFFPWEILPAPSTMADQNSSKKSWNIYHQVQSTVPFQKITHASLKEALKTDLEKFFLKYKNLSDMMVPIIFQPDLDREEVLALMRLMNFYEKYLLIENSFPQDLRKSLQEVFQDYNLGIIRLNLQMKLQYFYMWTQSSRESAIFHRWWNSLTEQQQMNVYLQKRLLESVYRTSSANAEQQVRGSREYLNFYKTVSKKELCTVSNALDSLTSVESEEWKQVNLMRRNKDQVRLLPLSIPMEIARNSSFVIQLQLRPRAVQNPMTAGQKVVSDDANTLVAPPRKDLSIKVSRSLMALMNISNQYEGPQNCFIPTEDQMLFQQKVLQTQLIMKKMGF